MDLEDEVFKKDSAREIARSLKRSAERTHRRKSSPFRSAISMLTFYINRAGKNLSASRLKVLNGAKDELRRLFDRPLKGAEAHGSGGSKKAVPNMHRSRAASATPKLSRKAQARAERSKAAHH